MSPTASAQGCLPGFYCGFAASGAYFARPCEGGTYGNRTGGSGFTGCPHPCPLGFFCPRGTFDFSFFPCPSGTYCPPGSALPLACPPGYLCAPLTGVLSDALLCPPGHFCPQVPCTLPSLPCAYSASIPTALNNSWCPASGAGVAQCPASRAVGAAAPVPCPGGTLQVNVGMGFPSNCTACPVGSYGLNSGWVFPVCAGTCQPGSYGRPCNSSRAVPPVGCLTLAEACVQCAAGSFSPVAGSAACQACPAGSWSNASGVAACIPCDAGRYSSQTGASSPSVCAACPPGTYTSDVGQSLAGCVPCPRGTYGLTTPRGAVTVEEGCAACPYGTTTLGVGSSDALQCQVLPITCPLGAEPALPPFATATDQCTPIVCPALLRNATLAALPAGLVVGCLGCPPGRAGALRDSGSLGGCAQCGSGSACPGLTSAPVLNLSAAGCLPRPWAQTLPAEALLRLDTPRDVLMQVVIVPAAVFLCLSLGLGSALQLARALCPPPSSSRGSGRAFSALVSAFVLADLYALRGQSKRKTLLGACFTLLGMTFLVGGSMLYLSSYLSFSNIRVTETLRMLSAETFPAAGDAAALQWLRGDAFSGVRVLVTAWGEPGACSAPQSYAFRGIVNDPAWVLEGHTPTCSSGAAANVQAFSLTCAFCDLRGSNSLVLYIDHSCQALQLQASATGPYAASALSFTAPTALVYSAAVPYSSTTASSSARLATASLHVNALHATVVDLRGSFWGGGGGMPSMLGTPAVQNVSGRGYIFLGHTFASTFSNASGSSGGGGGEGAQAPFTPRASAVTLGVTFSVQSTYSAVTLDLSTSLAALISSIFSLFGLFGVVGFAFEVVEGKCAAYAKPYAAMLGSRPPARSGGAHGVALLDRAGEVSVAPQPTQEDAPPAPKLSLNPLYEHGASTSSSAAASAAATTATAATASDEGGGAAATAAEDALTVRTVAERGSQTTPQAGEEEEMELPRGWLRHFDSSRTWYTGPFGESQYVHPGLEQTGVQGSPIAEFIAGGSTKPKRAKALFAATPSRSGSATAQIE